jgi:hypothetical protein
VDRTPQIRARTASFVLASLPPSVGANYLIAERH